MSASTTDGFRDVSLPMRPTCRLMALLLTVSATVLVNLPYRYVPGAEWVVGRVTEAHRWEDVGSAQSPVMAGWPFRFWVAYETGLLAEGAPIDSAAVGQAFTGGHAPEGPGIAPEGSAFSVSDGNRFTIPWWTGEAESRWWSGRHLAFNLLFAAALAIASDRVLRWGAARAARSPDPLRARRWSECAAAAVVLAIPVAVFGWHRVASAGDAAAAERLAPFGHCHLVAWLPEPLARRCPGGLSRYWARVRYVRLDRVDDEAISRAVAFPGLVGLQLGPGDFTASLLEPLSRRPHFAAAVISRREVSESLATRLAECPWLLQLDLSDTDLDGPRLRPLDRLGRLLWVDLTATRLRLSDVGRPGWSASVRRLRLPRPEPGRADRLVLEDWPQLRELEIGDPDFRMNPEPVALFLRELSVLTRLRLDRVQCWDLDLDGVPRLGRLEERVNTPLTLSRLGPGESVPCDLWLSGLRLRRAHSLTQLRCHVADLRAISVRNCRGLHQLSLSTEVAFADGTNRFRPSVEGPVQAWIDEFGSADAPRRLCLRGIDLDGVELAPLANRQSIRRCLDLSHCRHDFAQVRALLERTAVCELTLGECPLRPDELEWLLGRCPRMRHLAGDWSRLSELRIAHNDRLWGLGKSDFHATTRVELNDLPNLRADLCFRSALEVLRIRDLPHLRGLRVETTWPASAEVRGVGGLRWLVVGGATVDDQAFGPFLDCQGLNRITVVDGSLSPEMLRRFGRFRGLRTLELPGAAVDDTVTCRWETLEKLRDVCLDQTSVSGETIRWLSRQKSLESLSLGGVRLDASASASLADLNQLSHLGLAGASFDPAGLRGLLAHGLLQSLDLADVAIDGPLASAIAGCNGLESITVSGHQTHPAELRMWLDSLPGLTVRFAGPDGVPLPAGELDVPAELVSRLAAREAMEFVPMEPMPEAEDLTKKFRVIHHAAGASRSSRTAGVDSIRGWTAGSADPFPGVPDRARFATDVVSESAAWTAVARPPGRPR